MIGIASLKITLSVICVCLLVPRPVFCGQVTQERAAIQISSTASDGRYSIPEIISSARKNGVRIIILGERDLMRWEYGLWPLRNLIKKRVEEQSLSRYGVARYLEEVRALQVENPDLVILPGVESAPYYYWTGSPFAGSLRINDWHRHILTFGLKQAHEYERLPVIGNRRGLAAPLSPVLLLSIFVLCCGLFLVSGRLGRVMRCVGWTAVFVGIILIINEFPFRQKYDQYMGDMGVIPYKTYVDYAGRYGALTFWSHPEAVNTGRSGRVAVETRDYSELLSRIDGYTGFFIFHEGYNKIGCPGGIWDRILDDYCKGRRQRPVWACAGLAVDSGGLEENMRDLRTTLLLDEVSAAGVIKALKAGKMYVARGANAPLFVLDGFSLTENGAEAGMGEELRAAQKPIVSVSGHLLRGQKAAFQIKLIHDGRIAGIFEVDDCSFLCTYRGETPARGKGYYRAEITAPGLQAVTNPIFFDSR